MKCSGFIGHATCSRQDEGCKGSMFMFHLSRTLLVLAFFLQLVLSVARTQPRVSVGRSMRVKNPYIKESTLKPSTPEAVRSDVKPSTILSVLPILLLQKPSRKSKAKQHSACLERRSSTWQIWIICYWKGELYRGVSLHPAMAVLTWPAL